MSGKGEIAHVAAISAQDPEVGGLIAEAFDKVGKDGVITVEESNTMGLELELTEGLQFDKGYISPYFVSDTERMEAVLDNPLILLNQGKISSVSDLLPLLEKVIQAGKTLLVIAEDVDGEALSTLVVNKIRGTFQSVAVKAPAFGDRRKAMLEDIAILTGAQVVAPEVGLKLDDVGLEVLGTARRVTITKDDTTIVDGAGSAEAVADRVRQLRAEIERTDSEWDRDKLQERLAKLAGGVAVIRVGAATEVELKEKKHRLEDAISATRAAVEEGIVAGGGSALVHAASALDNLDLVGDEATGATHRAQGARRAASVDRREQRPRGLRRHREGCRPAGRPRTQRGHRRVRRSDRRRRHRPRQGDPVGACERGVDRGPGAHDGDTGRREARERPRPTRTAGHGHSHGSLAVTATEPGAVRLPTETCGSRPPTARRASLARRTLLAGLLAKGERAAFHGPPGTAVPPLEEAVALATSSGRTAEATAATWLLGVAQASRGRFGTALTLLGGVMGPLRDALSGADTAAELRLFGALAAATVASVHRQLGRHTVAWEFDALGLTAADALPGLDEAVFDCRLGSGV